MGQNRDLLSRVKGANATMRSHMFRLRNPIPTAFPPVDLGLQNLRSDVSRAKVKGESQGRKIETKVKAKDRGER